MSDYNSNYSSICCPFCKKSISENSKSEGIWVDGIEDEEVEFFQCQKCDKYFKACLLYTSPSPRD